MKVKDNNHKYRQLREQFSFFEYQSYSFKVVDGNLEASFVFNLDGKIFFKPKIYIPSREFYNLQKENEIANFVFHMGMVELVSYWKATCSSNVLITPHGLNMHQVSWWKKLYFHGLGEFFYLNNINVDIDSFMNLSSTGSNISPISRKLTENKVLVPIGGGKDSIVSLELLKPSSIEVVPLIVNPREASIRTINIAGFEEDDCVIIKRSIDPQLLQLNEEGYLNGHTPFSAMLAFVCALGCHITGVSNIALSNESSANEATVPGSKINHQYSKTFEFENDFNDYIRKYLNGNINYFSFLRPINELQIAALFSRFERHFDSFRSCNVGSKVDSWCGKCPKCMFTYIILSPFIERNRLIEIFGKDMTEDEALSHIMNELQGKSPVKPFECVGTPDEVNAALSIYNDTRVIGKGHDYVLDGDEFNRLMHEYNLENLLPDVFDSLLKDALDD